MRLLVCGGAGFIGSNFVRQRLTEFGDEVVVLDKLTYAGREENFHDVRELPGFTFVHGAIEDPQVVMHAIEGCDAVVNFAAETHVDRSIAEPDAFVAHARARAPTCCSRRRASTSVRYVQVSTDEVYGSIEEGTFTETSPLAPSSPYSATKAGADLLVASYRHTFGTETLICRGSNNYGPYQYPEKLIPLMVLNALHGDKLPVYGDGMQVRNWIYVEDFARGIGFALDHGVPGEVYNVGGPDECPNLEVVNRIVELTGGGEELIEYVTDRPGPRPPLLALLGEDPRARLGAEHPLRRRASSAPSPGTATTAGGGSRSARATTAPTTSASTGARSAEPGAAQRGEPPRLRRPSAGGTSSCRSLFSTCAVAVGPVTVTSLTVGRSRRRRRSRRRPPSRTSCRVALICCASSLVSSSVQILPSSLCLPAVPRSPIVSATAFSVPWKSFEDDVVDAAQPPTVRARTRTRTAGRRRDMESADQTIDPLTIQPCSVTPPLRAVGTRRPWR